MRVPVSWLKDFVDITIPVEELAHRLTLAGLEVSAMEYIGVPAGETRQGEGGAHLAVPISTDHLVWDRDKLVVGHVVEVKQHPNADRLVLAMVESGIGEVEQVVTGAPNLFPYIDEGPIDPPLVVAYAREGAELVDPYSDKPNARMTLKPRSLRGIENRTMVCSEKELGISQEHEGIMILHSDAAPGTPLQDVLGDVVMDIDLTPNLARAYSILGVAREVAALTGQQVRPPSQEIVMEGEPIADQVNIDIREPELNPRFAASLIKDIEIRPSPPWMQRRLRLAGMRPISNIVDVTNYVMLEIGQPLHAFDYDVLRERAGGKTPTIITRTAEPGEVLTTLDGVERKLDPFTELVADTAGALSIAGMMGGEESEVSASTTSVLLEAANWNLINQRQTQLAQRERGEELVSEAGTRFSRGVHPAVAEVGLRRATELMRQLGNATVAKGIVDEYPLPAPEVVVNLHLSEVERILGIALSAEEVTAILEGLQFGVEPASEGVLRVTTPDHRLDIGAINDPIHNGIRDVVAQADLLEEIARIYGYDRLPATLISDELPPQRTNIELEGEEHVRDILVRLELQEIITYGLTAPEREALLMPPGTESDEPTPPYVTLANPISQDKTVMRRTMLPGILDTLARNLRWQERLAMFEVGKIYLPVAGKRLPAEPRRLAIALTGRRDEPTWQQGPKADVPLMDYYDLKGIIEELLDGLHLDDVHFEAVEESVEGSVAFFPSRTAQLVVGGEAVGLLGELHPLVAAAFELPDQPVLIASLDLDALLSHSAAFYAVEEIVNYPAVYQDIALIVDEATPAAEVEAVIRQAGGGLLRNVRLFDVYQGEQIGAGKKSLAYALTFQAPNRTLRDKDADKMRKKIVRTAKKKLGAVLRG